MTAIQPSSQNAAAAREEFAAAAERLTAAFARRNPRGIAACYAPGALLLPPGYPAISGRSGIEAFWWAGLESGLRRVERRSRSIEIRGDLAIEVGDLATWLEPSGVPATCDRGKYVVLHRREAHDWMRAVEIFNLDGEAPSIRAAPAQPRQPSPSR